LWSLFGNRRNMCPSFELKTWILVLEVCRNLHNLISPPIFASILAEPINQLTQDGNQNNNYVSFIMNQEHNADVTIIFG